MCVCLCVYTYSPATLHMYSQSNLQEPVLFFHHVEFGDKVFVLRFGRKCLYLLNHLTDLLCLLELVSAFDLKLDGSESVRILSIHLLGEHLIFTSR